MLTLKLHKLKQETIDILKYSTNKVNMYKILFNKNNPAHQILAKVTPQRQ